MIIEDYKYDGVEVFAFTLYEMVRRVGFEAFACGRCGEYIVDTGSGPWTKLQTS